MCFRKAGLCSKNCGREYSENCQNFGMCSKNCGTLKSYKTVQEINKLVSLITTAENLKLTKSEAVILYGGSYNQV